MKPDASQYNPDPQYMRDLVGSSGKTQPELSLILGVTDRTIRNWTAGRQPFPYTAQFAMECLVLSV